MTGHNMANISVLLRTLTAGVCLMGLNSPCGCWQKKTDLEQKGLSLLQQ